MTTYTLPVQTTINIVIPIHPQHLKNLNHILYDKVTETLPTCRKDYGYILNILEITKSPSALITHSNGFINVDVKVIMNTLLPSIGNRFKCCITGFYPEGIFVKYDKMVIFCPKNQLLSSCTIFDDYMKYKDEKYKIGDWIDVEIIAIQYVHKNYQCIGKFFEPA